MTIYPSAKIRQDYNLISNEAKKTKEPIYLTKNGEGDLVIMDIEAFHRREKMLKLKEELLSIEEERIHGVKDISVEEAFSEWDNIIEEI
ncbi:MAG: type II toxin-antitoxin system Phd/YefM family antitoxin [Firmicutes bacterium]|nr:type II toxin-antitoxin system Phd/YefM family antitoxin [Candidatus Colivicinus equi]